MKQFPNGFTSWAETHYEIVSVISIELQKEHPAKKIAEVSETQGTGGLYELAEDLTDKFELLHAGREWDGEFFDAMEEFLYANIGN
jgi:hypothetical protein